MSDVKYLMVVADTNDGDYVHRKVKITPGKVEEIMPVIEAIKKFKPYKSKGHEFRHNFPQGECLREDMGEKEVYDIYPKLTKDQLDEFIEEYAPYAEYGIHTIKSIELVSEGEKLL
jgi:hypothetical protein